MRYQFCVIAINPNTKNPGMMGYRETYEQAVELQGLATRSGWLSATICDSEKFEEPRFSK